jgi:hypothetical protein
MAQVDRLVERSDLDAEKFWGPRHTGRVRGLLLVVVDDRPVG